jgi:biotin transporter BioY
MIDKIQYAIMAFVIGYSGYKFFSKNKDNRTSILCGCASLIVFLIVWLIGEEL